MTTLSSASNSTWVPMLYDGTSDTSEQHRSRGTDREESRKRPCDRVHGDEFLISGTHLPNQAPPTWVGHGAPRVQTKVVFSCAWRQSMPLHRFQTARRDFINHLLIGAQTLLAEKTEVSTFFSCGNVVGGCQCCGDFFKDNSESSAEKGLSRMEARSSSLELCERPSTSIRMPPTQLEMSNGLRSLFLSSATFSLAVDAPGAEDQDTSPTSGSQAVCACRSVTQQRRL